MLGAQVQRTIPGILDRALSWLAFLNGHRVGETDLKRLPALSVVELDSVRQIYSR